MNRPAGTLSLARDSGSDWPSGRDCATLLGHGSAAVLHFVAPHGFGDVEGRAREQRKKVRPGRTLHGSIHKRDQPLGAPCVIGELLAVPVGEVFVVRWNHPGYE